jgi:flagella basal body P-ring formation protein FlgA
MKKIMLLLAAMGGALVAMPAAASDLAETIAGTLQARIPAAGRYKVMLPGEDDLTATGPATAARWSIRELQYNPQTQSFTGTVARRNELGNEEVAHLSGTAYPVIDVPALARDMQAGETVEASSLATIEVPAGRSSASLVTAANTLVGQVTRRNLRAGAPLFAYDFSKPVVVRKGDLVTIVLEYPGIQLSAQGQATANAGKGDVIALLNTNSRRLVEARITGPGMAVINPAIRTTAER